MFVCRDDLFESQLSSLANILSWQFDSAVGFDLLSHIICGVLMTIRERN
jgi:hypothetical protein